MSVLVVSRAGNFLTIAVTAAWLVVPILLDRSVFRLPRVKILFSLFSELVMHLTHLWDLRSVLLLSYLRLLCYSVLVMNYPH